MSDTKKFQVNFRTPSGSLINLYGDTHTELAFQLKEIGKLAAEIAATEQLLTAASNAAPLAAAPDGPPQVTYSGTTTYTATPEQPQAEVLQFPQQGQAQVPTCMHGPRQHRSGTSKRTNKPYSGWYCPQNQCEVQWGG